MFELSITLLGIGILLVLVFIWKQLEVCGKALMGLYKEATHRGNNRRW